MPRDQIAKCAECGTPFALAGKEKPERCPMCERIAPAAGRKRGIVKWYSRGKGYGFITGVDGADVFLHKSGLREEQAPRAGQLVEFAVEHGPRGAQAVEVEALTAPTAEDAGAKPG
jgi:CspA family cold shock protein